jgi:hypothetical protein
MSTNGNHDDDITRPDLPGLGPVEEHTLPGVGPNDVLISIALAAGRALAAIGSLATECPPPGSPGRRRHLEVLSHHWGELGVLCHDTRRAIIALKHEED